MDFMCVHFQLVFLDDTLLSMKLDLDNSMINYNKFIHGIYQETCNRRRRLELQVSFYHVIGHLKSCTVHMILSLCPNTLTIHVTTELFIVSK